MTWEALPSLENNTMTRTLYYTPLSGKNVCNGQLSVTPYFKLPPTPTQHKWKLSLWFAFDIKTEDDNPPCFLSDQCFFLSYESHPSCKSCTVLRYRCLLWAWPKERERETRKASMACFNKSHDAATRASMLGRIEINQGRMLSEQLGPYVSKQNKMRGTTEEFMRVQCE